MYVLTWLWGLLKRRPIRLAGAVIGIAAAVALLGSLGAFFAASKAHMTRQAAAGVIVDWQVQMAPGANPAPAAHVIAAAPGVVTSLPVAASWATAAIRPSFFEKSGPAAGGVGEVMRVPLVKSVDPFYRRPIGGVPCWDKHHRRFASDDRCRWNRR